MTIKLTQMNARSGDTSSTKNGMPRNIPNSGKLGEIQLVQLWMPLKYNFEGFESFLQNIRKNNFIISSILKINHDFNIILIQELSWSTIRSIPCTDNCEGAPLVGISSHPNWLTFTRESESASDSPRVAIYINIRLSSFQFSLQKDVINHRDFLLISFCNNNSLFWIMNIYSNSSHSALKYFKNSEANIPNLLIMTGDFNICDSIWDPSFPHHSSISDNLIIIADSFNLDLSVPTNQVPTRYLDTNSKSNSVIDLIFLHSSSPELNSHSIHPDWQLSFDHTPLTITIPITEENIIISKFFIAKNSNEEELFIKDVTSVLRNLNISNLSDSDRLENIVNTLATSIEHV